MKKEKCYNAGKVGGLTAEVVNKNFAIADANISKMGYIAVNPLNNGLKPILRPMSDLFKRIKVDGYNDSKEFIPIEKVSEILDLDGYQGLYTTFVVDNNKIRFFIFGEWIADFTLFLDVLDNKKNCSVHISFMQSIKILELLNQWHFDYRGLIGKGLAVDVNHKK